MIIAALNHGPHFPDFFYVHYNFLLHAAFIALQVNKQYLPHKGSHSSLYRIYWQFT